MTLHDGVILLRPWSRSDARFMWEASKDPLIVRYNGPTPESVAQAISVIAEIERRWRSFEDGGSATGVAFAVVDATSGETVGMCGVDQWSDTDVSQLGYWLAPEARGRGFATRAVRLMTQWLFDLGAARAFLTIHSTNTASAAVARRAGFLFEGTLRRHGVWQGRRQDVDVFAALPDEWTERSSAT